MKKQNVQHDREWAFSSYMSLSLLQLAMSIEEAPINAPRVVAMAANPWQLRSKPGWRRRYLAIVVALVEANEKLELS